MLQSFPRLCLEGGTRKHSSSQQEGFCHTVTFSAMWHTNVCASSLLSCSECSPFKRRELIVGIGYFSWACGCVACKAHAVWPSTRPFKHSGLGFGLGGHWPLKGFSETCTRWMGPVQWDGKILCEPELRRRYRKATHEWMDNLPSVFSSLFRSVLHGGALWGTANLQDELESWRMQQKSLLTDVYCMGLKCRKSLWECQRSRKEKTSLVPWPSYIFKHLKQLCPVPVLLIYMALLFKYEDAAGTE